MSPGLEFSSHQIYLNRCLQLAALGSSMVYPNPRVGAVIVHEGQIIGEGFHQFSGGPHAEVEAVNAVEDRSLLPQSTIYVSLEPCNFHGKTPACSELILRHKIPKVVIGCTDPNPKVAGMSIQRLREAGVEVNIAPDPQPFEEVIRVFRTNQLEKRPYVVLKWAESQDGFIAGLDHMGIPIQTPITGRMVKEEVHRLRAYHHAIMVGRRTAEIDNPQLNTRLYPGENPIRIVWDKASKLRTDLGLLTDGKQTLVLSDSTTLASQTVSYYQPKQWENLLEILQGLYSDQSICSILVEGGTQLLQQFIDQGIYDEVYRFVGNKKLGKGIEAPNISTLPSMDTNRLLGEDRLFMLP
ncbi:MAG: bifunctional diaminohydroxyphosphoribosylaminopyrimidine deaminase/5-amino-6-(5-phosphoribosylamino)uracil reductase RibD [Bacteroidota bacterium]